MDKDQVKRDVGQVKGSANKATGKAFGNGSLEERGKIANSTDKVQQDHGNGREETKK
jgi:uncharacterized protein YjbJ (UPF0337 family)